MIIVLLVVGLTRDGAGAAPAAWRVLPFTDSSAQHLSTALRRLMIGIGVVVDFLYRGA